MVADERLCSLAGKIILIFENLPSRSFVWHGAFFSCSIGPVTSMFLLLAFRNHSSKGFPISSLFAPLHCFVLPLKFASKSFIISSFFSKMLWIWVLSHWNFLHSADLPLLSQFWMAMEVSVSKFKMHVLKLWDFVRLFVATAWVKLVFPPPKSWSQMRHFILTQRI